MLIDLAKLNPIMVDTTWNTVRTITNCPTEADSELLFLT